MTESAASVRTAAQALADLASAHASPGETIGGIVSGGETHVATSRDAWGGPRADVILGAGEDYLTAIKPAIGALESVGSTLTDWSAAGFEYADRLQTQEASSAALGDIVPIEPAAADRFFERHRAISTAIDTIAADWASSCTTFANKLADDTTTLLNCNLALLPAYDGRAADDNAYVAAASELAVVAGIPIATVDSSGWLESKIGERAAYLGSEDGALMFMVIETANQENIDESDGNLSQDDIEAATNPAVVRALLLQAGERNDFEWDSEALDLMVAETVATAWTMRASADEEWEDIDDDVEWHERGVFRFAREHLLAPAYVALVGGVCCCRRRRCGPGNSRCQPRCCRLLRWSRHRRVHECPTSAQRRRPRRRHGRLDRSAILGDGRSHRHRVPRRDELPAPRARPRAGPGWHRLSRRRQSGCRDLRERHDRPKRHDEPARAPSGGNGLIATTRSRFVANGFAIQHRGVVYVIDDIGGQPVHYDWRFMHLAGEQEVVFTRIESSMIRGAYTSDGTFVPNPFYGS